MNRANDAVERVASASNGSGPQPLSAQDILEVAYNQTRVMGEQGWACCQGGAWRHWRGYASKIRGA